MNHRFFSVSSFIVPYISLNDCKRSIGGTLVDLPIFLDN